MKPEKAAKKTGKTKSQYIAIALAAVSIAMPLLALVSWFIGHWGWLSFGAEHVPMAPSTALLLVLLNAILLAEFFWPEDPARRRSCRWVAVLIAVSGLLVLLRPFFGWPSPLEVWLSGTTETVGKLPVGQMSPLTGLAFLLSSAAFLAEALPVLKQRLLSWGRFGLSMLVIWIGAIASISYLSGISIFSDRPIIPMALWTAITFILTGIAIALKNDPEENPALSMAPRGGKTSDPKRSWILLFSLIAFVIITGGFVYYRAEAIRIQKQKAQMLAAIGKIKVEQILLWHKERVADIARFAKSPAARPLLKEWRHHPDDAGLKKSILERLKLEIELGTYFQALLADADKHILLSFPEAPEMETESWDAIKKAWDSSEPVLGDLHFSISGKLHEEISMAARDESGRPLAVMMLISNPEKFLFPMIQSWPIPSRTSETLLVRREGEAVLFLNELRHRKGTAMVLRIPLSQTTLPAAQAVLGRTGTFVGKDYRGAEVLSDLRPVPGTSWYLVSKEDTSEILGEVRYRAFIVVVVVVILILGVAVFMGYAYRVQRLEERKKAVEALTLNKEKLDLALSAAHMGVWQFDLDENKRTFDDQTCALLGIEPARFGGTAEEFFAVVHPGDRDKIQGALARTIHESVAYSPEYRVVWSDGSIHHIMGRGKLVCDDQGKPKTINGVIWDITDRKETEAALRKADLRYRELVEGTEDLITIVDPQGHFTYVNHTAEKIFGLKPENCLGRLAFDFIHPEDRERTKEAFEGWVRDKKKQVVYQNRQVNRSGQVFEMLWSISLHFDESGKIV